MHDEQMLYWFLIVFDSPIHDSRNCYRVK